MSIDKLKLKLFLLGLGWLIFIIAGLKGFPFWYDGFLICFWLFIGLLNYSHRTTLWLVKNRFIDFLKFYVPYALFLMLFDMAGLKYNLWMYPIIRSFGFLWVYLVLYPLAGLILIELIYFLSGIFKEKLIFVRRKSTLLHQSFDISEKIFFAINIILPAIVVIIVKIPLFIAFALYIFWVMLEIITFKFHIRQWGHYCLIILIVFFVAVLLNEVPNTGAFEWMYLKTPFPNQTLWGVPIWVGLGWLWFALFTLRMWILIILHPKEGF